MKTRYRSHRYDIYRPRSWHEHKYSEYQKCLNMMMLKCIKQHLSKILSSVHEKVKQYWAELKESIAYKKSVYSSSQANSSCCHKWDVCSYLK